MAKKTPKSKARLQYEREYRRVTQAIRRQRKIGYDVPTELKPISPSKMEKITAKDVKLLQEITPQFIREHSELYETYPPKENNLNLQIIEQITELLTEWTPLEGWSQYFRYKKELNRNRLLIEWNDLLLSEGEYEVAYRIENDAQALMDTINKLIYASSSAEEESADFAFIHQIIFGRALTASESDWYNTEATSAVMDSLRGGNSFA